MSHPCIALSAPRPVLFFHSASDDPSDGPWGRAGGPIPVLCFHFASDDLSDGLWGRAGGLIPVLFFHSLSDDPSDGPWGRTEGPITVLFFHSVLDGPGVGKEKTKRSAAPTEHPKTVTARVGSTHLSRFGGRLPGAPAASGP